MLVFLPLFVSFVKLKPEYNPLLLWNQFRDLGLEDAQISLLFKPKETQNKQTKALLCSWTLLPPYLSPSLLTESRIEKEILLTDPAGKTG